jgi:hypothetical protein
VARLGSPRFAEREDAARKLESLGGAALPALRSARIAADSELRSRASALIDRIESNLLVRPTLVRLGFKNRPLAELVKDLASQADVPLFLNPDESDVLASRRVTLEDASPVPFWSALERLCRTAHVRSEIAPHEDAHGHIAMGLSLAADDEGLSGPISNTGPFRVKLVSVHYQRERQLDRAGGQPVFNENFYAQIQLNAEPRLMIAHNGNPKLLEVNDDAGHSLLPRPDAPAETDPTEHVDFNGGATLQLAVGLNYPAQPGKLIKRFRGVIPVTAAARKPGPVVVSLQDSVGKVVSGDEIDLTVLGIRIDANEAGAAIELRVRPRGGAAITPANRETRRAIHAAPVSLEMIAHQIDVFDARGRVVPSFPQEVDVQADGARLTLRLASEEGVGAPKELRFYGVVRAHTEVPFDFTDVEMP